MANLIISRLDYLRLKERALQAKIHHPEIADLASALLRGVNQANLVEATEMPADIVTMNSLVRILYLDSQKTMDLRIVYPEQASVKQNRISVLAPMGMALLGSRKGEIIRFKVPHGMLQIRIERLLYQPEAAGHFFL